MTTTAGNKCGTSIILSALSFLVTQHFPSGFRECVSSTDLNTRN